MPRIAELDYAADPGPLFVALRDEPWPALLESGHASGHPDARYDILSADPFATLTTRGTETVVERRGRLERSARPPLELLRELLGPRTAPAAGLHADLPFAGGALGYFAYDFGRLLERLPSIAAHDVALPDVALGLYDWAIVIDHAARRTFVVGEGRDPRTFERWDERLERLRRGGGRARRPFAVRSAPTSSFDRESYGRAFERIKRHIRAGDCYQVNLTQRFSATVAGDSWQAYRALRRINPAPFAAFLELPGGAVLSSSPERFLRVRDGRVETKPIKGTRPRAADPARDRALAEELAASGKDRAENVMIVDLLRNDLGKSCAPGSVRATKLFDVESFASVHHLVSTVEGRLAEGKDALDLLAGCFPGGSITGAPKLAAMQIIEAVEPHRRSVYCGCIGYIGFDGAMDTSIAIRTLVRDGERIHAWAGGGVVADSEAEAEYQESLDKAAALLAVLGDRAGPDAADGSER